MDEKNYLLRNILINKPDSDTEKIWFNTLERIGQEYFCEDKVYQDLTNLYIMQDKWEEVGSKQIRQLGQFELDLLERIKKPSQPVLLLKGCIGSGKTTTCRYITEHLKRTLDKLPVDNNFHIKLPLIPIINCSRIDIPKICNELDADIILTDHIMYALDAAINDSEFRQHDDFETINFWDYGLSINENNSYEYHIFNMINSQLGEGLQSIEARKELNKKLRNIFGHKEYLSYLFALYGYIRHEVCAGIPQGTFIIIDNVDQLQILAQRRLLDIISSNIRNIAIDPLVVMTVRPEARMAKSMGTNFIDVIEQQCPSPRSILSQRVALCLKNYDMVKNTTMNFGLNDNDYQKINKYLLKIQKMLGKKNPFSTFITYASNGSVRIALWMADGIIKVSKDILLTEYEISTNNKLIRSCITQGSDYQTESENHLTPIHNLFRIHNSTKLSALLIQSRILLMLHDDSKLTDMIDELENFGYDYQLILSALNDLLRIPLQLIVSSGTEQYNTVQDLLSSPQDEIKRTVFGENYILRLIKEPTYVQEMMFNTWVSDRRFHENERDFSAWERFDLLYRFIYMLIEQDYIETRKYLYSIRGEVEHYARLMYTSNLITYDLLIKMIPPIGRIIDSIIRDIKKKQSKENIKMHPQQENVDWEERKREFYSLLDWAQYKTKECFTIQKDLLRQISELPDPSSR